MGPAAENIYVNQYLSNCSCSWALKTSISFKVVVPVLTKTIVYLIESPAESPPKPMSFSTMVLEETLMTPMRSSRWTAVLEFVIDPPYAGEPVTLEIKQYKVYIHIGNISL